jgi:vancomycin resistance protein YoaR
LNEKAKYLALALFLILCFLIFWDFHFWTGRFPPNSYVENIEVSGLSKYEVLGILRSSDVDKVSTAPFQLNIDGTIKQFKPSALGMFISPRRTIHNSIALTYRSNYIIDLLKRIFGMYRPQKVPLAMDANSDILRTILLGFADEIDVPSKEATFTLSDGGYYNITKEKIGKSVDIAASIYNIEEALRQNKRIASLEIRILSPRVYAKPLVKHPPKTLLSEYTTYYGSHDSPNRVHNIKLSSSRTNNYILASGEVFSMLSTLGDFTGDSGYKEAFVLYNGQLEPQYGGGSCQIASTLYNAALLAGLEMTERYNHGIYFTIYPLGRDSSIYSPSRDLKFRNNTNHPVYIKAFATDKRLTYKIYGTPTARKVSFSRPMIFFDGEAIKPYIMSSEESKERINKALLSGKPFYTIVKVTQELAGYVTERSIVSHYKMTGDRENVKIVRPEPE